MSITSETKCICPLNKIMNLISKKWTLLVINVIGNNQTVRFNEIIRRLNGVNSKTLSDRLKELETFGLISRKVYAEIPPRVEYSLTVKGKTLRKAILPLMEWIYTHNNIRKDKENPCDIALAKETRKNQRKTASRK